MKLTFLGATHEVTGSCTMVECGGVLRLGAEPCDEGRVAGVLAAEHLHRDRAVEREVVGKVGRDGDVEAERRAREREALNGDASARRATSAPAQVAAECRAGLPNFVGRVVRSSAPVHFWLARSLRFALAKTPPFPKIKN